jgi:predicted  nucleic acid-binding Zn-ribbon protein
MFSPTTVYSRRSRISDGWRVRAGPNEEIPSGQHGSNSEDEAVRQLEAQIEQLHSKSAKDMEAATNNVRVALEQQSALRNALQEESSRSSSLESESAAAREETESLKNKLEGMAQHISQITHGSQVSEVWLVCS